MLSNQHSFQNSLERTFDVFFYGLNMDADVLVCRGVVPRDPRLAVIEDYIVRLGAKAMLLRSEGGRAFGMLFRLTHGELQELYAGVDGYRAEAFLATPVHSQANNGAVAAISMVHLEPSICSADEPDSDYGRRWDRLVRRLGIPRAS